MELMRQEFRKLFLKKSLLIVIVVLSIINVVKIGFDYKYNAYYGSSAETTQNEKFAYEKLYSEQYAGELTLDKISTLMEYINSHYVDAVQSSYDKSVDFDKYISGTWFGDYHAYYFKLYLPMKYAYEYKGYAQRITQKASDNVNFYKKYNNAYEVNRNVKIIDLYKNREINYFYDTEGASVYLNYDFSSLLILIVLVYALTPVFVGERIYEMQSIISISKYGMGKTAVAKIFSSIGFAVMLTLWFTFISAAQHFIIYSADGLNLPIYAIEQFKSTPLTMTILQFLLTGILLKVLSVILFAGLILISSSFCSNWVSAFAMDIGLISVMIILFDFIPSLNIVNPIALLTVRDLFTQFETVNILNNAINTYIISIFYCTFLSILEFVIVNLVYSGKTGNKKNKLFGGQT